MKRLPLVLVLMLIAGGAAACGSGGHKSSDTAQIKSAYEKFFSSKTPLSERVSLLENGSRFKSVIASLANNPLASKTSATVSSVTLQGSNQAKVVYQVKFSGASLPRQTGAAVRENGTWKVGSASLCKLIALGGTTPPVCKKS